jgi:cellulose synthase operon protein C
VSGSDAVRLALLMLVAGLAANLSGCAGRGTKPIAGDDAPTLKTLAARQPVVPKDVGIVAAEERGIEAYRQFLAAAPNAPQRPEAMRRLGDLEMDRSDRLQEAGTGGSGAVGAPDYKAAIARYEEVLKNYPKDSANDRVLYQLARAHEQSGALGASLKTLDRLVAEYPQTRFRDEAQFRRGELLFTTRDYPKAEQAYANVLKSSTRTPYHERSLYMQGWSQFKQSKLDDALRSFFGVLDAKVAGQGDEALESLKDLTRADRELVEDTFRVTSLSLANLQGADTIAPYIDSDTRRSYEFRVYQQLGELYLKQERTKDAADTLGAFARKHPLHAQAPQLQARVIDIYAGAGFAAQALDAKKDYVSRYGIDSQFRKANPQGWLRAQPLVKTHLAELATHHHALAQKSKLSADTQEAVKWYRAWLVSFPDDVQAAQNTFLLAELLAEDKRLPEAVVEYEKAAYNFPPHARSADAGYAALLGYAGQEKTAAAAAVPALQREGVDSALRFAAAFPQDQRTAPVLANAAERLFTLNEGTRAAAVAQQLLALEPPADLAQRRVAWSVIAHTAFDRAAFGEAERAYAQVLPLVPENDSARSGLVERLAAAVYKQGEQARAAGDARAAVGHFARVASVAPGSSVRASAQVDAAAALIGLKDWDRAARTLEDFRQRYPNHPLAADVPGKLAVVYLEKQQWGPAAGEFERIAASHKDAEVARGALWQAAELHAKAGAKPDAARVYERYLKQYPQPLEPAVEARWHLATTAREEGNTARALALSREAFQADQGGGAARTGRTRTVGALAALELAAPVFEDYRKVALVEPLARQLKLKKAKMEDVLKAYAVAADYGVAEVTTAATFRTAALYHDFGKSMLASQRPKKLKKAELEQYDVMLEEQAFPFEEKAAELHQVNARRTVDGLYDEWVRGSFKALAELRPARYGKAERSEGSLDLAELRQAVQRRPQDAVGHNQLGIALRHKGQFDEAKVAYEQAIALAPNYATPVLNLAVLLDLYLQQPPQALTQYERYRALVPAQDAVVDKWIAELKSRKPDRHVAASTGNQERKP